MEIDAQKLDALTSRLKVHFTDQEPRQTVQVDGFAPIYFQNTPADRSDNLPGFGCGETIRSAYGNPDESYEPLVTAFFIWLHKQWPALSMIDVGALWGQTSFIAASIFERSDIHLFEMNPFVAEVLQRNADLNRQMKAEFHVRNMLLSKFDGQELVTFKHYTARYRENEGGINLSQPKIFRENLRSKVKRILGRPTGGEYIKRQMRIATIDTYCREQKFVPNLIKVDVEGSEYDVLSGTRNTMLQHHPLLLVEFHAPDAANYVRKTNRELLRMLEQCGYRCLWNDHHGRHTPLYRIDNRTELDIEVNSLGIFY